MWRFIFLCFFLIPSSAFSLTWFLSEKESSHKWAVVPSYSRSGSLGNVLGSRFFVYPTTEKGLYVSGSLHWKPQREDFLTYKAHLYYWTSSRSEWEIDFKQDTLFDSVYKFKSFGNESRADLHDRVDVPSQNTTFLVQYLYSFSEYSAIGGFFDFYHRKELGGPCSVFTESSSKTEPSCFGFEPESQVYSLGFVFRQDTRDRKFNPQSGYLLTNRTKMSYNSTTQGSSFFQTEFRYRLVNSLSSIHKWILNLGLGWGAHPEGNSLIPYSNQFKLGGMDDLRGYRQGRFLSSEYYLIQNEFRVSLYEWLQGILFMDLGEIELFSFPYPTVGIGFLVGLPPHYDQQIRIEWGMGKLQKNFVVTFALPY